MPSFQYRLSTNSFELDTEMINEKEARAQLRLLLAEYEEVECEY